MEKIKYFKNPSLVTERNNELNEYRKIGKFTDLTLKSTDGKTMTVNKNILSAACPYFKGMFNSDLVESRQDEIQLVDDVTIADLDIIIEYFYTGEAKVSLENAENLYIKAQYLQLKELQQFCSDFLIENITLKNGLIYWRHSVKYMNDMLKVECLKFIKENCKSFLETKAMDLTAEELKIIVSEETLIIDQEDLYRFVTKWIKQDFETRNIYLMDFIKKLDFKNISDEFIENEIMIDDTLLSNLQFSSKMASITFQKLREVKKQLNSEQKKIINSKSSENIHLVTNSGIHILKAKQFQWNWSKQFNLEKEKIELFASVVSKNDIFISGGRHTVTKIANSDFESWNITSGEITKLPQTLECRRAHKLVNLKEKIYCCGGFDNKGSIEIFDFETLKWNRGPTMNDSKYHLSLITSADSIYSFGGWKNADTRSNIVELLDPREGKWSIISSSTPNISHAVLHSNNLVYGFDCNFGGKIFDLRTNSWTDSLASVFEHKTELNYYVYSCDIVEFNDETFGVFQTDNNKTWGTFKYDHITNKWADLRIPLHLNEYVDIRLLVNSVS